MKTIIAAAMVVGIGGMVVLAQYNKPLEVENTKIEKEVVTEEVVVDVLQKRIEDAQNAARPEIEAEAMKAYENAVQAELQAIEDTVKMEYITELEETIESPEY